MVSHSLRVRRKDVPLCREEEEHLWFAMYLTHTRYFNVFLGTCDFFQIQMIVKTLSTYMPNARCHACVIGVKNICECMRCRKAGAQVVVGTPDSALDMIVRKSLSTSMCL